jgi:hypothetical protein
MKHGILLAAALLVGCATARPSPELVDARAAYARAHAGPAVQANTAGLTEAKKALDEAEKNFVEEPGSDDARHLAYLAHRKVLVAEADARAKIAETQRARTEAALAALRDKQNGGEPSERKARGNGERNDGDR